MLTPDRLTNIAPPNGQPTSTMGIVIDASIVANITPRLVIDSLRSLAGAAGGETTVATEARAGATTIDVVDGTNIVTASPGTVLYLWNGGTLDQYSWEKVEVASAVTGVAPAATVTLRRPTKVNHGVGAVVSATPPFDDVFAMNLHLGTTAADTHNYLVFSNANPVAIDEAAILAGFAATHLVRFSWNSVVVASLEAIAMSIPTAAMPCRYFTFVTPLAAVDSLQRICITLHRKRGSNTLLPPWMLV